MPIPKFNRWAYFSIVVIVGVAFGVSAGAFHDSGAQARLVAGSLLIAFLTYPAGIVGTLFGMALANSGIATPAEALFVGAPLYAVAGVVQWYVVLPRMFGRPPATSGTGAAS
jgi:hypothetical protein